MSRFTCFGKHGSVGKDILCKLSLEIEELLFKLKSKLSIMFGFFPYLWKLKLKCTVLVGNKFLSKFEFEDTVIHFTVGFRARISLLSPT